MFNCHGRHIKKIVTRNENIMELIFVKDHSF